METQKKVTNDLFEAVIGLLRNAPYTIVLDSQNKGSLLTISKATHKQAETNTATTMLKSGTTKEIFCYLQGMRDLLTEEFIN